MRKSSVIGCIVLSIGVVVFTVVKRDIHAQPNDAATAQQSLVEHGKYIVHHVAMCVYCHTPRNEDGILDFQRLLQGAPMPVESPFEDERWAFQAPKIAGLPGGWNEVDFIRFLQTGETTTGRTPQPPMPPFRMNKRDASAVAAYLKSIH